MSVSTSAKLPTVGADSSALGTITWATPGNITATDGAVATGVLTLAATSHYLMATGFGFTTSEIVPDAIIEGIEVVVRRNALTAANSVVDAHAKLVIAGAVAGSDLPNGANWPTSLANQTYGGPSTLWGLTPTPAQLVAANFGFALSAIGNIADTARVDSITIKVYWRLPYQSFVHQLI